MRFAPVRSATLAIVATAFQRMIVIVAFVWLSRTMAQETFGAFSFLYAGAVGYASVVLMPASQSFGAALGRHGDDPAVANFYLAVAGALALLAAFAYLLFVRGARGTQPGMDGTALAIAVALVVMLVVAGMLNAITFAAGDKRAAAGATFGANIAGLLALFGLGAITQPLAALGVFLLISVLGTLLVVRAYPARRRLAAWPAAPVRRAELRQLLPLVASGCLGPPVHALCLSFLLHGANGLQDVALFNAAFQFYGVMIFVPGVLAVVLMPYFRSGRAAAGDGQVGLRTSLLVNFVVCLVPLAVFVLGAPWLSGTVFGPAYARASTSVVLLSLVGLLFALSSPCLQWFIANKRTGEILLHSLTYSIVYVVCAYWLIQAGHGHVGLSAAFLGATLVLVLLQAVRIRMLGRDPAVVPA